MSLAEPHSYCTHCTLGTSEGLLVAVPALVGSGQKKNSDCPSSYRLLLIRPERCDQETGYDISLIHASRLTTKNSFVLGDTGCIRGMCLFRRQSRCCLERSQPRQGSTHGDCDGLTTRRPPPSSPMLSRSGRSSRLRSSNGSPAATSYIRYTHSITDVSAGRDDILGEGKWQSKGTSPAEKS